MSWYSVIDFIKGRTGRVLVFAALFLVIFVLIARHHARKSREQETVKTTLVKPPAAQWWSDSSQPKEKNAGEYSTTELNENFEPFLPPVARPAPPISEPPPEAPKPEPEPVAPLEPLILSQRPLQAVEPKPMEPATGPPSQAFVLEEGDLLRCQLLAPVTSQQRDAPVRARLSAPLIRQGRIILPAGTQLMGRTRSFEGGRVQFDRKWIVELPRGERAEIVGEAQEGAFDIASRSYLATDGSVGIPARTTEPDDKADHPWRNILGTLVSAAGRMSQDRTRTALGDHIPASGRNVLLEGVSDLVNEHTEGLTETPRASAPGTLAEMPAGTGFYIEVQGSE